MQRITPACSTSGRLAGAPLPARGMLHVPQPRRRCVARAHTVELELVGGRKETLTVEDGDNILEAALQAGLDVSHDCKMGVCMTCPAKLVSGQVDQSAGMLDDEAREKGYTLLCVSEPQSDCHIQIIEEDELLEQVLCSSSNVG